MACACSLGGKSCSLVVRRVVARAMDLELMDLHALHRILVSETRMYMDYIDGACNVRHLAVIHQLSSFKAGVEMRLSL